jgi:hypothetical protein
LEAVEEEQGLAEAVEEEQDSAVAAEDSAAVVAPIGTKNLTPLFFLSSWTLLVFKRFCVWETQCRIGAALCWMLRSALTMAPGCLCFRWSR